MELKANYPEEYKYFSKVLDGQGRHMVPNLPPVQPPPKILGDFGKKNTGFSEEDVQNFARKCLLSELDVKMWLTNIQTIKSRSKKKQKKKRKPVDEGACTLSFCITHAGYIMLLYNY